jgi:large subunit ribosomal protein L23
MSIFSRRKKDTTETQKKEEAQKVRTAKEAVKDEVEEKLPGSPVLPKGEDAESYRVILKPHITEKGTILEGQGKYLFRVARTAAKPEIKKAIEKLYKVRVRKVHIQRMPSKFRQVGKYEGRKPGFKKAVITLKEGERIEIAK